MNHHYSMRLLRASKVPMVPVDFSGKPHCNRRRTPAGGRMQGGGGGKVYGRSRMTMDPCIPTMPGRTTIGGGWGGGGHVHSTQLGHT